MSSVLFPPTQPPPELPERPEGLEPAAARPEGNRLWRPWTAPAALVGALAIAIAGGLVVAIVAALLGYPLDADQPPGALLGATVVQQLGFIAAAVVFARLAAPTTAAQFGLRGPDGVWRAIGITLGVYVVYALFTGVWAQVVEIEAEDQLDQLGVDESTAALVGGLLVVCVGAPIAEEFLFRGYVFAALRNWRGPWLAALLTGALFGAIHVGGSPAGALVPLAVLGAGLCLIYQWTGSLYPCVALHAINNGIAFGVMQEWGAATVLVVVGATTVCALVLAPVARRWTGPRPAPPPAPVPAT